MLAFRSLVFNTLFYIVLVVCMIIGLPSFLAGRKGVFWMARLWTRISLWMLEKICGVSYEFRGIENLPKSGVIVAAKHQSFWETFALSLHLHDFTFILKRELMWLPFFGWYLKVGQMIGIDRGSGRSALRQVVARSKPVLAEDRQLVIFPEGTRRKPGAPPAYKFGVAHLYTHNEVPCVPVALNSGLFWPRRSFLRRPGTVVVEFLEPIQPGLAREEFFELLQKRTEAAVQRLVDEALAKDPSLADVVYRPEPEGAAL